MKPVSGTEIGIINKREIIHFTAVRFRFFTPARRRGAPMISLSIKGPVEIKSCAQALAGAI